jgi:SnoaL-like protein
MPSRETVDAFVAQVLSGDHVGAIRDWYAEDASMQENQAPPRLGKTLLMEHEAKALARSARVETELLAPPLIEGDCVAIRWRFTFFAKAEAAAPMRMEEVAWQTWRGDKIASETFFYDPKQIAR